jgi:hypothetical protein
MGKEGTISAERRRGGLTSKPTQTNPEQEFSVANHSETLF